MSHAPAAHDITDVERLARKVRLTTKMSEAEMEKLALMFDIIRRETQQEMAEELKLFDHADAAETLRANGMA